MCDGALGFEFGFNIIFLALSYFFLVVYCGGGLPVCFFFLIGGGAYRCQSFYILFYMLFWSGGETHYHSMSSDIYSIF